MKKRAKNNNKKKNRMPGVDMPDGWFYMSDKELTAAAVKEALDDAEYGVEYWEEAQVLEIVLVLPQICSITAFTFSYSSG